MNSQDETITNIHKKMIFQFLLNTQAALDIIFFTTALKMPYLKINNLLTWDDFLFIGTRLAYPTIILKKIIPKLDNALSSLRAQL
jgi:hypothetical protein